MQISVFVICLMLSAYFSSSETALTSVNKIRIFNMAEEGDTRAKLVLDLLENPTGFLSTILVGNNLVNVLASSLATSLSIEFFGNSGVGIATGLVTLLVLIFGEVTPKSMAVSKAEDLALSIAPSIAFLSKLLKPLTFLLLKVTGGITKLFGGAEDGHQPFVTQEEFLTMVNVGHEEGVLEEDEKEMLENVFEFKDSLVRSIMTPRPDITYVELDVTYAELKTLFKEDCYSRIPVCDGSIDKVVGFLHVRDFATLDYDGNYFDIKPLLHKPYFTFELQSVTKLLHSMRQEHVHIAIVLDEYGGTAGLVTIEDLIEEIIGEIEDEYDEDDKEITKLTDTEYLIDGSTNIEDVNDYFDFNISDEDSDSIGGFLYGLFDRVPEEKESVQYHNLLFTVQKMDKNRIETIRLKILPYEDQPAEEL